MHLEHVEASLSDQQHRPTAICLPLLQVVEAIHQRTSEMNGRLPAQHFHQSIAAKTEDLAELLKSFMQYGYVLRRAQCAVESLQWSLTAGMQRES